jgi:hypothetical protein
MKRIFFWVVPLLVAIGAGTMLRADDSMPASVESAKDITQADCNYVWYMQNYTELARDQDAMGVQAVLKARDMIKSQNPDQQAEFFTKMLYDTKSRAVGRTCRMQLFEIYRTGRPDKAMEQLQALITEQPQ